MNLRHHTHHYTESDNGLLREDITAKGARYAGRFWLKHTKKIAGADHLVQVSYHSLLRRFLIEGRPRIWVLPPSFVSKLIESVPKYLGDNPKPCIKDDWEWSQGSGWYPQALYQRWLRVFPGIKVITPKPSTKGDWSCSQISRWCPMPTCLSHPSKLIKQNSWHNVRMIPIDYYAEVIRVNEFVVLGGVFSVN